MGAIRRGDWSARGVWTDVFPPSIPYECPAAFATGSELRSASPMLAELIATRIQSP